MTREQLIAHMELHDLQPYKNALGWLCAYSHIRGVGWTTKIIDGKRDLRPIAIMLGDYYPCAWSEFADDVLEAMVNGGDPWQAMRQRVRVLKWWVMNDNP